MAAGPSPFTPRRNASQAKLNTPPSPLQRMSSAPVMVWQGCGRPKSFDVSPRHRGRCLGSPTGSCQPSPGASSEVPVHNYEEEPETQVLTKWLQLQIPDDLESAEVDAFRLKTRGVRFGSSKLLNSRFEVPAPPESKPHQCLPTDTELRRSRSEGPESPSSASPAGPKGLQVCRPKSLQHISDSTRRRQIFDVCSPTQEFRQRSPTDDIASPVQSNNSFENSVCDKKQAEDKKHYPGIHPLAYETCLSSRLQMLRDSQHELNRELLCKSQSRIEEGFQSSLCEAKKARYGSESPSAHRRRIYSRTTTVGGSSCRSVSLSNIESNIETQSSVDDQLEDIISIGDGESGHDIQDFYSNSDATEPPSPGLKGALWEMKPFESGRFMRRCRSSSPSCPTTHRSSLCKTSWRRLQNNGKPERVKALATESFKSLEAFLEDVKRTDIDPTLSTRLQALLPEYQRLYSQTLEGAQCDEPEGKCAEYPQSRRAQSSSETYQVPRSPVYVSSPIQSHRTLEACLCNEKKSEDARHAPGIHPLAYETCLTKRGEMLREVKRLNAEFVPISPRRINEHFQQTVAGNDCDRKGPPTRTALRVRRSTGSMSMSSLYSVCTTSLKKACTVPSSPIVPGSPITKILGSTRCPTTTADDTKIAADKHLLLYHSGSQVSHDSQVEHCFKIALSQLRAESPQPRPRCTQSYSPSPRRTHRSELRAVSPVQTQKELEKVICSTKKEEDAKHTPGLHPLAYESSLSKRFLMLRDHRHEVIPDLLPAAYKTEKQFKGSLCDWKQEEDKFARQAPRPEPMKAAFVDLPGFKNLWALSSNAGRVCPPNSGMASPANPGMASPANPGMASPANSGMASPARSGRASPPTRRVRRISNP